MSVSKESELANENLRGEQVMLSLSVQSSFIE
jgi:hypothetical protein